MADCPLHLNERARLFWARTILQVWPQPYLLVSLPTEMLTGVTATLESSAGRFAGLVIERDEIALTVDEQLWLLSPIRPKALAESGPYRVITCDVKVDLDVVGYLAPAAVALAKAGISIVPQCGYLKDHLLVAEKDLEKALQTLQELISSCKDCSDALLLQVPV
jgi:hypothetical protein